MLCLALQADDKIMIKENGRLLATIRIPDSVAYTETKLCFDAPRSTNIVRGKAARRKRNRKKKPNLIT